MNKKPNIIVIEDDDILANFLVQRLMLEHMDATRYANGLDAVSGIVTAPTKVDLILLDISLPDIDGFEVLKRISPYQTIAQIPVIIISNFSQETDIEWGKRLGVKKFLNKASVTPVEIVEIATEVLAASKEHPTL